MPEHTFLKETLAWLQDMALFCSLAKPPLLAIVEFVLFFVGLATVLRLALRAR